MWWVLIPGQYQKWWWLWKRDYDGIWQEKKCILADGKTLGEKNHLYQDQSPAIRSANPCCSMAPKHGQWNNQQLRHWRQPGQAAHNRWLRQILRISCRDKVTNEKIRELTQRRKLENVIRERRLWWTGHVMRMEPARITKTAVTRVVKEGNADLVQTGCKRYSKTSNEESSVESKFLSWQSIVKPEKS